ncbi:MAG: PepSY domain-containing protein [Nitrospira sp.]|nr:PepSY domain-containing protein [Nitrospira sp.]
MNRLTQWMNWLHSWFGLLFGWLLFAVFLTGTLTVFDTEITAWMQPDLHEITWDTGQMGGSIHEEGLLSAQPVSNGGDTSIDGFPLLVKLQEKRTFSGQTIDPATGQLVIFRDTQGGDFFYHFHYGLLAGWPGAWLIGSAAIVMLIALATGMCGHRWTFKDVVMIRLRPFPRAWLDAHNLTGILIIPFHLMIVVTGLTLFWSIYMPVDVPLLRDSAGILPLLSDLHFAQFGGNTMRWLYFIMGLAATVMIATGLILWTIKRQRTQSSYSSQSGYRIVEVLNVATVAGALVAVAAFFWANRLLPLALPERSLWEIRCFFIVWSLCLLHSLLRRGSIKAWREQLYGSACLLGFLPLLNGLTTNSHLLATVPKAQWAIAGVDLTGLTVGALLGWTVRRVGRSTRAG